MACIYRRGNRFWISYYVGAKQIKKSLGTDNERVARSKLKHARIATPNTRVRVPTAPLLTWLFIAGAILVTRSGHRNVAARAPDYRS